MLTRGILWMNQRNNIYVKEFNPDRGIRLANNKEQTKKFLFQRSIPVPKTFLHIKNRQDRFEFNFSSLASSHNTFVIKPNNGSKGQGIFIINEIRKKKEYTHPKKINHSPTLEKIRWLKRTLIDYGYEFRIGDKRINEIQLKKKVGWIFQWLYSSNGKQDTVLIEEKLIPWNGFELFCTHGLADMRIIMFNLVPVIAMLRVPTEQSGGKANLAQWGIGLGIDIVTGKINSLYRQWQSYTNSFPSEWSQFKNKKIPYRQEILEYSANAQYFVNSWYLGMDRVVTTKWPKLLEINARAWLEIQNITGKPLLQIMKKIEDLHVTSPSKGLEISRTLFSPDRTSDIKPTNTIYLSQPWRLLYFKDGKKRVLPITISVSIDKKRNYTSETIIEKLTWAKNTYLELWTNTQRIENIKLYHDPTLKKNTIILWKQTLKDFFIIPSYKSQVITKFINKDYLHSDEIIALTLLDEKINHINKKLNLSKILKPTNYLDEFDKFVINAWKYNPQFSYQFPTYKDLHTIEEDLKVIDIKYRQKEYFDSQFAQLFFDKIDELYHKINLIRAYKKQDLKNIEYYNILLFWNLNKDLLDISHWKVKVWQKIHNVKQSPMLNWFEIFNRFQDYIYHNNMNNVKIKSDSSSLSGITVWLGKNAVVKIKTNMRMREYKVIWKLAHEIDVHVKRYLSGRQSWWHILKTWTAGYITTEEWLAIYVGEKKIQQLFPEYENIAQYESYLRLHQSTRLNFEEMAHYIQSHTIRKKYEYKPLFNAILKTKKGLKDTSIQNTGIVFWKNCTYLNGYTQIKDLSEEQKTLLLSIGKIKITDLKFFNFS